jgi:hypothetical protein
MKWGNEIGKKRYRCRMTNEIGLPSVVSTARGRRLSSSVRLALLGLFKFSSEGKLVGIGWRPRHR